jgi:hypothetical protein
VVWCINERDVHVNEREPEVAVAGRSQVALDAIELDTLLKKRIEQIMKWTIGDIERCASNIEYLKKEINMYKKSVSIRQSDLYKLRCLLDKTDFAKEVVEIK